MVPLHARLLMVRSEGDLVAGWTFSNREQGFNRSSQPAEEAEIVTAMRTRFVYCHFRGEIS